MFWYFRANDYLDACFDKSSFIYSQTPESEPSLYATCYSILTKHYLNKRFVSDNRIKNFLLSNQEQTTGFFIGPEIQEWSPPEKSKHDREHILLHLTCTVLPVLNILNLRPRYPLSFAHKYLNQDYLIDWLNRRDMSDAWLEGNNLLFVGQLLVYLRDFERRKSAEKSLEKYFSWLEKEIDPDTGLWGTNKGSSIHNGIYGAYHQLLLYYHENYEYKYKRKIIDSVLSIQHYDGGFSLDGGGGACEDVDAVDILVNMYKIVNYRRNEIRYSLKKCLRHIKNIQNEDGGFPYKKNASFVHMGIPATRSGRGQSNVFSTWFRIHTIALISEIIDKHYLLADNDFLFNKTLSMGWHRSRNETHKGISALDKLMEKILGKSLFFGKLMLLFFSYVKKAFGKIIQVIKII